MGTRATIKIIQKFEDVKTPKTVTLYHHFDGYPEYLGKFLVEQLTEKLGNMYLLKKQYQDIDVLSNFLIKNEDDNSFELTCRNMGGIEYIYTININHATIKCQKVRHKDWFSDKTTKKSIDLIKYLEKDLIDMVD